MATNIQNFIIVAGGSTGTSSREVDIYDESLSRTIGTNLSEARYEGAAASIGNFALIAGGISSNAVDAYTVV